ncbi:DUF3168 domain-containing protein [Actinocorallia longicatena]|uniref:DUF3168 domain-containing protein n=1 Tax=Actinocorallia longicatena TaxID=111803 RepID=A0ABP6QE11_9ACTN
MIAEDALDPVQQAVYDVLAADAVLEGLGCTIWDEVPEGTPRPYIVLGESMETPDRDLATHGRQTVETLHIWSKKRGMTETKLIMARVQALLDHQPLTIAGHRHIVTRWEFGQTLRDPEPGIRHGVTRFRIITEQEISP